MAKHWSEIPPALPPDVIADIWREIGDAPQTIPEKAEAFVRVAIDHPHYATATDIAGALGMTYNFTNPIVHHVKKEARDARLTTGTR